MPRIPSNSKLLYKSEQFSIWKKKMAPDGVNFEIVSVNTASESVMIVPRTNNDKIVLIKKYFPTYDKLELVFPGGKVERGHSLINTAEKELIEETGLKPEKLTSIGALEILPGYFVGKTHGFIAQSLKNNSKYRFDSNETKGIETYTVKQLHKLIMQGKIKDARTVAFFYKFTTLFPDPS